VSYLIKSIEGGIVKDIDTKEGVVSGYFSRFGNVDSDNDIMARGCFTKSIQENGPQSKKPRIAHLWAHDSYTPIGKLMELMEDDFGLFFRSKLSKSSKGRDTLHLYEEGIINEHSIGFQGLKYEDEKEDESKPYDRVRTFKEVKLWEGSSVVFGANPDTPTTGVKDADPATIDKLAKRLGKMEKLLRKGSGLTDEAFIQLELECAQIRKELHSLVSEEPRKHSEENEPNILEMWQQLT